MGFGLSFVSILLNCALVCIGQVKIENVDLTNRFMKYQLCSQVGGTAYTDNNKLWPKKKKSLSSLGRCAREMAPGNKLNLQPVTRTLSANTLKDVNI